MTALPIGVYIVLGSIVYVFGAFTAGAWLHSRLGDKYSQNDDGTILAAGLLWPVTILWAWGGRLGRWLARPRLPRAQMRRKP